MSTAAKLLKPKSLKGARTRLAILESATRHFMDERYEFVALRSIARDAGIDVAQIGRYFGSKARLFEEVLRNVLQDGPFIVEDRSNFGERLAELIFDDEDDRAMATLMLVARAAMSPEARPIYQHVGDEDYIKPFAEWLGHDNAEQSARLIAAVVTGLSILRRATPKMDLPDERKAYAQRAAGIIQALVDGR